MGRRLPISLIAISVAITSSLTGASNRSNVYPNSTLKPFAIVQGKDGFLWLATAEGLYQFDGFHFHKISGFPMSSARFLASSNDKSLWAADFQGLVRMHDGRFDRVLTDNIMGLAALPNQVFAASDRLEQIALDGSVRRMDYRVRRDLNLDLQGRLWGICLSPIEVCWIDPQHPEISHGIAPGQEFYQAALDIRGRIWVAEAEFAGRLENGRLEQKIERRSTTEGNRPGPLLQGQNGHLWFLGEAPRELASGIDFHDRADHDRFAPLAGFEDSSGHLWISSLGQGLVEWIPDENWERWFPEDFSGEPSALILRDRNGGIVAATHKYIYRKERFRWHRLTSKEQRYDSMTPFEGGGFLASIRDFGVARLSDDGAVVERVPDLQLGRNQYRQILRDPKGRFWIGAKRGLLRLKGRPGSLHFEAESLPGMQPSESQQAVSLALDRTGKLWVGYDAGIAWLDDADHWHRIETSAPVVAVRSITVADNEIWVAYRRPGVFSQLIKNGTRWDVTQYPFAPRDTYFVKRDSQNRIWRGTPNGVYVADGVHFGQDDWLHIHMGNGLAANELDEYGFFEDADGSIWITGEEGVTHVHPDASWFESFKDAPPIQVTRVEADGRTFIAPAAIPLELPNNIKVLQVDLGTLGASRFRDAPLRWRLSSSNEWHTLTDGSIEIRDLVRGRYVLEAGYAGGPTSVIYSFQVGAPVQWTWLWLFSSAALAPLALRKTFWVKTKFRVEKSVFLLRRRFDRSAADAMQEDYSGEVFHERFRALRVLSQGGFSIVYEAEDLQHPGMRLAIKVLSRTTRKEGWLRDRFAHEVAALRSLNHPGVVPILDSWISPAGEPCLAMPLLSGETLRQSMPTLDRSRTVSLIRKIGDALGEVHAHGIVHRDLKPENIVLYGDQPVIVDFGSAGLRTAENELAETTLIAGSFHYMAPERLTGRYSPSTDTYAFAVIILELLSGKRLADLETTFSDSAFLDELSGVLGNNRLAHQLVPALNPDPKNRPISIREWAEEVAAAIELR